MTHANRVAACSSRDGAVNNPAVRVHATLISRVNAHGWIVYRAIAGGTGGNAIRVRHLGGVSQALAVSVSGNDITVQLGTNGSSVVTSTTNDVIAAVNAHG